MRIAIGDMRIAIYEMRTTSRDARLQIQKHVEFGLRVNDWKAQIVQW